MEGILFTMWIMLLGAVALFLFLRRRTAGKMLCSVLERDRSIRDQLIKVKGDFVEIDGDKYFVNPEAVRFKRYPAGWPVPLQTTVPACLYARDGFQPIDWNTQEELSQSAKEITAVLDPHIFKSIVRGTQEGGAAVGTGNLRPIFLILGAVSVVTLLTVFYLLSKIGGIETAVQSGI